jgi:hypothetical protein
MHWSDQINRRDSFLGAPDLFDGHSRVAEAMGGLADDDCLPPSPSTISELATSLDDLDRVHEAMGGVYAADDL